MSAPTPSTSLRTKRPRSNAISTPPRSTRPERPRQLSKEPGWHKVDLLPDGSGYLDVYSSPKHPPSASLRNLDGSVRHWLLRNDLDASHPYHPFLAEHVEEEFGSIAARDGQALYFRLMKPAAFDGRKRY